MIFYTPDITGTQYTMTEEESGHAVKVLRLKKGDRVTLVDGAGGYYQAVIIRPDHRHCEIEITETISGYGKMPYQLHIGIAPTKNTDRFEWFVEKAVEIGIDQITPLHCEHSERKHINPDRLNRIIISAMKQSGRAYLPRINAMVKFDEWLGQITCQGLIAYCGEMEKSAIPGVYQAGQDVAIAIGPEGDFSGKEVDEALGRNFKVISLGRSRLRTETAGLVACHSICYINHF